MTGLNSKKRRHSGFLFDEALYYPGWYYPGTPPLVLPYCTNVGYTAHRTVDSTADVEGTTGTCTFNSFEGALGEPLG